MTSQEWESLQQGVKEEAFSLDLLTERWLQERSAAGRRNFCAAGCSSCCTLFVQATLLEALIVAEALDAGQIQKLEEYVCRQRQSLIGTVDFLAVLRIHRFTIGPCPFLDGRGCCSIYAQRPLACRALLSSKPSEWCCVDFSTLDPLEKRLYLDSLEHEVVAFPVHYVARSQEAAERAEGRLLETLRCELGGAVNGNFPLLVYLAASLDLVNQIKAGRRDWREQIAASPLFHPCLLNIE